MVEMTDSTVSLEDIRDWMVDIYISEFKKYLREKAPKKYMKKIPNEDYVIEIFKAFIKNYIDADDKLVEAIRNELLNK